MASNHLSRSQPSDFPQNNREFALTTPYFEKGLQAGTVLSHAVWVVGPLSGLIAAPIVGTMSDRCTSKLGRRRPFIIVGLLATVVGMIVFSHADVIASLFLTQGTDAHRTTAIVIAILAFCVLDLAINTTMWPSMSYLNQALYFQYHIHMPVVNNSF